jgi:fused signal recognition particle receptor
MDELKKIYRVANKLASVNEVLLVLDATVGQNGLKQSEVFYNAIKITGIVLTKMDGTAKGGIVISVQNELKIPVKFIGIGEDINNLEIFNPEKFVDKII